MNRRWYRSFYWRIGLGFIFFLAATLAAQAIIGAWLVSRSAATLPSRAPANFAEIVARDLGQALASDPALDLQKYVDNEYAQVSYPIVVVMRDGRVVSSSKFPAPEGLVRFARNVLERRQPPPPDGAPPPQFVPPGERPPAERPPDDGRPRAPRPPGDRGFMLRRRALGAEFGGGLPGPAPARIIVNNAVVGIVVVPPRAGLTFLMRELGPALGVVAVVLLAGGTALAAFVIFKPARRRLRALEEATSRLGSGDLSARAPVGGFDEIDSLAHSFNTMADELSARARRIEQEDRRRRQLLADVSHELGTPLTAIRGYIETLTMRDVQIDAATRERYLGIINDETMRLGRIVSDLLDLARLENDGPALRIDDVAVSRLFDRVVARHERVALEKNVRIETVIADGVEEVRGDGDRLEQALQNLAANALRHTPPGGSIELRAERSAAGVTLSVVDSGEGIPEKHLPHVFDRFYKADQSRAGGRESGSGLGLSIVKAIAERHGGRVTVESRPGRTAFSLSLPN